MYGTSIHFAEIAKLFKQAKIIHYISHYMSHYMSLGIQSDHIYYLR